MKKRISSLCAVLLLLFVSAFPVYASEADHSYHHVLDAEGLLTESETEKIESAAAEVLAKTGVDLFAYVTGKELSDPGETGSAIYNANAATDASVIMMIDQQSAYIKTYGRAASIFTGAEIKSLLKQAKKQEGSAARLLKFVDLTGDALTKKGVLPIPEGRLQPRLVDDAGLLSQSERYSLVEKLNSISEKRQLDVVVVTNDSLGGKSVDAFADDFFDYNGYGYGENDDGILLLLSMDTREWAISTYGSAISIFTDSTQQAISDNFLPYLSDGDYFGGFTRFAELCDSAVEDYYENGSHSGGKQPFGFLVAFGGSLLVGLAVGALVAFSLKSQLTSVKPQAAATAYAKQGSMKVTERTDLFLYHNITRVAKPKETSSSSGGSRSGGGHSTTHVSSSGRTHGGSHGKF